MQGDTHREREGRVCVRAVHGSLPHSHAATTAAAAANATTTRRGKRGEVVWETAVLPSVASVLAVALVRTMFLSFLKLF
ncbi:nucleolar RNA helicase II [Trypanosoma cruzi Dm28c]|uniref:Nucleolar RNA helicase II n=1 Tax=Trypanosoma cruzi Dm28c TaxID=1416333 RepID=V5CYM7_TRYCR|nr:nucleolar RNA helicase II [Trypanosoma cruzi Dm28c]